MDRQLYGKMADGAEVLQYTLTNAQGIEVKIVTYGGTITSIKTADRRHRMANVVLGFSNLKDYVTKSPYLGCITGRFANRIANGRFTLDGVTYKLAANNGPHALHGGRVGFDRIVWAVTKEIAGPGGSGIELHYCSPDGDEGYPGALDTYVTYLLDDEGALRIHYRATTDAPTIVNLTNHTLWNLAGEGEGSTYDHVLRVNADRFTPVDKTAIPNGKLAAVAGTPFDFRTPRAIGDSIRAKDTQIANGKGIDHNFVLNRPSLDDNALILAATVSDPESGRVVDILTTEPGIQVYTGNFLDGSIYGASGRSYRQGDGIALETQHFPDSPNRPDFPSTVLRPGQVYDTTTIFKFGLQ